VIDTIFWVMFSVLAIKYTWGIGVTLCHFFLSVPKELVKIRELLQAMEKQQKDLDESKQGES
jgi:hypothetical protein